MTNLDDKITNSGWVILELAKEGNIARGQFSRCQENFDSMYDLVTVWMIEYEKKKKELESVQKSYAVSCLWSAMYKNSMKLWRRMAEWEKEMCEFEAERGDKFLKRIDKFAVAITVAIKTLCNCDVSGFQLDHERHGKDCAYRLAVEKEMK